MPLKPEEDVILTVREISQRLRVTVSTVNRWITDGYRGQMLLAFKVGLAYRIREACLEDFLHRCNPETWKQAALEDEKARRRAKKEQARVARLLGG